jgi:hypothetical protein
MEDADKTADAENSARTSGTVDAVNTGPAARHPRIGDPVAD